MKKCKSLVVLVLALVFAVACTNQKADFKKVISEDILINQIGYISSANKVALIRNKAEEFTIKNKSGETVFEGSAGDLKYWNQSGDSVRIADFSALTEPGEYFLCINNNECSYPFSVNTNLFGELADAALKSYYFARCSFAIDSAFGGKYQRAAGHPDAKVLVHKSAADKNRPEGTELSLPGGWYDAGDYGKYIVNSSITTYTLLLSTMLNEKYHKTQNLNIPESTNDLPDILDETLVNLRWMMSMQDPNDGGVYHKMTTKNFDSFIMPEETTERRYLVQKSTSAALDFTATMAAASRVFQHYEMPELAEQTKHSAQKSWQWAITNPEIFYIQPDDITTGAYGDTFFVDEWFWAASEMYLTCGGNQYREKITANYQGSITPKWDVVNMLGIISLLASDQRSEFGEMENDYIKYIDKLLDTEKASPYLLSLNKFEWGSNSDVANHGMLKLIAYKLTENEKYLNSARNDLDYILGRNAPGYSFITGFGHKTPLFIHQRISAADGIDAPIPGYLAGGPNTIVLTDCALQKVERSTFPAKSYTDTECSFSTNETAINWNAPLVFLASALDYYDKN